MSLHSIMPWLIAALIASVAGMIVGGATHSLQVVALSAALFGAAAVAASLVTNLPYWRSPKPFSSSTEAAELALRRNVRLVAIAYAWGAFAMQALYSTWLTGLRWQHGWQYSMLMLLLAIGAFHYARSLGNPELPQRDFYLGLGLPLTMAQALGAAAGLLFLSVSGKLFIHRSDWAANQVFLFGALTLMVLSAIALKTHARLTRE